MDRRFGAREDAAAAANDTLADEYHVFFGPEGNMRVSEIWDSREKLDAFGEVLMPILLKQGMEFSGDPDIFEAHDIFKR